MKSVTAIAIFACFIGLNFVEGCFNCPSTPAPAPAPAPAPVSKYFLGFLKKKIFRHAEYESARRD